MRKYIIGFLALGILATTACKKSELQLSDPINPTPSSSLTTEGGIEAFGLGIYQKWIADVPGEGGANVWFLATFNHSLMGDEAYSPYGNFGWRYIDQVYSVTLPAGNTIVNPNGVNQQKQLRTTNSRQSGELNSFLYEWEVSYFINAQANLLLTSAADPKLVLSGDAATKSKVIQAWAYWWKGIAYSRIGSMYASGIINNEPANGITNGNFVANTAIITEANANFDKASALLNGLQGGGDYDIVMKALVPSFNDNTDVVEPAMWIRNINSYKARNYLVNRKVATMTTADWTTVATLATAGIQPTDNVFRFGMNAGAVNDLSANFFHPYAIIADGNAFAFVSERLVQDFKPGDNRFTKGFATYPTPQVNVRSRGLQFGTRYSLKAIEDGGLYATNNSQGNITLACSWEENSLMLAEAKIHNGDINGGLALVDQVRSGQSAGLAAVANTGLSSTAALEELRRERRIGLFLRGLAFYDARRWGLTTSVAAGGGRKNAIVLIPNSLNGGSSGFQALPCTMDYQYADYFDVPQNELDFNAAGTGSVSTVAPTQQ